MLEQTNSLIMAGITDTGLRRRNNEDSFLIEAGAGVCAVADGMGGAAAGEIASRLFIETVRKVFALSVCFPEQETIQMVQKAFKVGNDRILQHAARNPERSGMGCTAELLTICGNRYVIGHVGDSRTYLLRNGVLRQLTRDHSLVQEQVDRGLLTAGEASRHRLKNVILRAVGATERLALDLLRGNVASGDIFLLCSDGLTGMVPDFDIQKILVSPLELMQKVEKLVAEANHKGGSDNITVILVHRTSTGSKVKEKH